MLSVDGIQSYEVKRYKGSDPSSFAVVEDMFYVCYPEVCSILCFDECLNLQAKLAVNGSYYALCYDQEERCFYALDACCPDKIFILNEKFCEIGRISILNHPSTFPTSIACCHGCIYVAYERHIVCISSKQTQNVCYQCDEIICAISCTSSTISLLIAKEQGYEVRTLDLCGKVLECEKLCIDGCAYAIAIGERAYVLSECGDVFYIYSCPQCIDEDETCMEDASSTFFQMGEIEKGIACVLNSEGMKIQYAIEQRASIKELLEINQSVICVVNELTQLELSLYNRLCCCIHNDSCDHQGACGGCA